MRVVTPGALAEQTGSKYLGVLVAARYARNLNELRRGELMEDPTLHDPNEVREKLTTIALEEVAKGDLKYEVVRKQGTAGLS